jgi:hypothetical protein
VIPPWRGGFDNQVRSLDWSRERGPRRNQISVKKRELEQTLRAAARIARDPEFFLIGWQALHAYCRRPPTEVLLSQECDIYPRNNPAAANLIEAQLGRRSGFARRNGFYADVVTPEIASLPAGWERRLKPLFAGHTTAFCLEVHDLVVSKLAAGRLKDFEFIGALLPRQLVDPIIVPGAFGNYQIKEIGPGFARGLNRFSRMYAKRT